MSGPLATRSSTGCLPCKTRRKKCDETKPKCLRCQRRGEECPGYIYVKYKNEQNLKLRTIPAPPRIRVSASQNLSGGSGAAPLPALFETDPGAQPRVPVRAESDYTAGYSFVPPISQNGHPFIHPGMTSVNNVMDFSWLADPMDNFSLLNLSTNLSTSNISPELYGQPTIVPESILAENTQLMPWTPQGRPNQPETPSVPNSIPMTPGQASLFDALSSLSNTKGVFRQKDDSSNYLSSDLDKFTAVSEHFLGAEIVDAKSGNDQEDLEGVVMIISRLPPLDPNTVSNALPFLLQSYAAWINRRIFEPLRMTGVARDFVFKHFEGGEESRLALTLLVNIGGKLAKSNRVNPEHVMMLSVLRQNVTQRLIDAQSVTSNTWKNKAIMAFEAALETMSIHFLISPLIQTDMIRRAAAPIFRRLCPDPLDALIDLPSLLSQPLFSLRLYAHIDIVFSLTTGFPQLFRYETRLSIKQPVYPSTPGTQTKSGAQRWDGSPDPLVILFARISELQEESCLPTPEVVSELERGIRDFQPFQSSSNEPALIVVRLMVQECWRQAAYIYLYMAFCGESSHGIRVQAAMKQLMKLVNRTKPGHFPDEFLKAVFTIAAPAARRQCDRETIVKRQIARFANSPEGGTAENLPIIQDYWARADAELRPVVWADVAISRVRVLGL
ncbi:unnamed protein product [Rhizoctonia solani]|uniref:Zn(2)-C6 fungal-type domain-containing protein n=1 Tax=Rhizoctonia solani TaxID=456999 RepID=A0A8H3AW70_9AGAM|nr:unnamed protein product [Rhizoctonia solani]